jgi:hypothetical protein
LTKKFLGWWLVCNTVYKFCCGTHQTPSNSMKTRPKC